MEAVDLQSIRPRPAGRGQLYVLNIRKKSSLFLQTREETAKYLCLALAHAASQRIKSPPKRRRKDADRPAQDADPLPVARRSDGDCQTGSSPGSVHRSPAPSRSKLLPVTFLQVRSPHSGGTAPAHPASLLSVRICAAPVSQRLNYNTIDSIHRYAQIVNRLSRLF